MSAPSARAQLLKLRAWAAPRLLGQKALERVLQVPFAPLQLGVRPALLDRSQHAAVGVADDPLGLTEQRAEKRAPMSRMRAREGLGAPEPRLARPVADRAEDVEGDPPRRDPPPAGVQGPDPERQVVELLGDGACHRGVRRAQLLYDWIVSGRGPWDAREPRLSGPPKKLEPPHRAV